MDSPEYRQAREELDQIMREWRAEAGPLADLMFVSREVAESMTGERDEKVRAVAFHALHMIWEPVKESELLYAHAAMYDPCPRVREGALTCLYARYAGTCDPNASTLVARIAVDERNPLFLRKVAYIDFCLIRNIRMGEAELVAVLESPDDLPGHIEWGLLKTFAGA